MGDLSRYDAGELLTLDRKLERAVRDRLIGERDFAAEESPLEGHRAVSGLRPFEVLDAMKPSLIDAPLRDALGPWLVDMLSARLSYPALHELAEFRRAPRVVPPTSIDLRRERVSWDDAWQALLGANPAGAESWLTAMAGEASSEGAAPGKAMADAGRATRRRLGEVRARVLEKLDRVMIAGERATWQKLGWLAPAATTAAAAEAFLTATDDLAADVIRAARRRLLATGPAASLIDALARDATASFPTRIRARWFDELFAAHLPGVAFSPHLSGEVYGGASFMRGLESFGRALRLAVASRELPFALRFTPANLDAERFGAVFAGLAGSPSFARHALGSTSARASEDRRSLARTALFEARARAVHVLLEPELELDKVPEQGRFEELTARLFGRPLPAVMVGAWPLPDARRHPARLWGALTAPSLEQELVDNFDEDWHRNPRAFQWIRARGSVPTLAHEALGDDAMKGAPLALARTLTGLIA